MIKVKGKKLVLSLFNGINCIGLALAKNQEEFQIYASEIDKYANKVSNALFPETVNLGDVVWVRRAICWKLSITRKALRSNYLSKQTKEKLRSLLYLRGIDFDLIVAGSPCQGFSFAGKQFNFEDPRSKLFFDFIKILNTCKQNNPKTKFILENVKMKKEYEAVITKFIGISPIQINSSLVSAQNRVRLYWTNIGTTKVNLLQIEEPGIGQPKDRNIFLKDILQLEVDQKYILSNKALNFITKPIRIKKKYTAINGVKSLCLTAKGQSNWTGTFIKCGRQVGRKLINGKRADNSDIKAKQQIELREDEKTGCLTTVQKDNLVILQKGHGFNKGGIFQDKSPTITTGSWQNNNHVIQINPSKESNGKQPYQQNRIYHEEGKSPCLDVRSNQKNIISNRLIRRLTPRECCRLQTVPEWAIEKMLNCGVSDSQLYKMLGNGWTVEVIAYILKFLHK